MSGFRRLAIFLSALWVVSWFLAYRADSVFKWFGFLALGVAPVALVWAVVWVVAGFRSGRSKE